MDNAPSTIADLHRAYRDGAWTVREQLARAQRRIAAGPAAVWISRVAPDVLAAAGDALDARLRAEGPSLFDRLPLFGVPFAVKDNIDVAGLATTAACPALADRPAEEDATVVARLVAAGAVVLGKTNLDQFATGLVGTRSPYGAVPNPFDPTRISGGSSSGSAYAVAADQAVFALGTDTAGSGRVPAGLCNLYGLKPTRGWWSTRGVLPACRSLDCVSVFALTADDAWRVAGVAGGYDAADPWSRPYVAARLRGDRVRFAVPARPEFHGDVQAAAAFERALARLAAAGITAEPIDFSLFESVAESLYGGPWVAERAAAFGHLLARYPGAADPTVAAIVGTATRHAAADVFHASERLAHAARAAQAVFAAHDVLIVPTAPIFPRLADLAADPIGPNSRLGRYTNFVNLLDLAAFAVPGPFRDDGLPAGITLIGPAFSDHVLAARAADCAVALGATGGVARVPAPVAASTPAAGPDGSSDARSDARTDAQRPMSPPATARPVRLVAVGAHMAGLPLNWQLAERGARLVARTHTAPAYRLWSLTGTRPTRPALEHVGDGGAAIAVEVWELDEAHLGSLLRMVAPPLALGSVELADGRIECGFVAEARATAPGSGALDVTAFGGWRAFLASLA